MNDQFKDQLASQFARVLRKNPGLDPILLAERLLVVHEVVYDMFHQDSGIAALPEEMREEPQDPGRVQPWDFKANRPAMPELPAAPRAMAPAKPDPASLIVLPGSPEFDESRPKGTDDRGRILKAPAIRRPTAAASRKPEVPVWGEADLIQQILANTPEDLTIATEDREKRPVNLKVLRNVHNQAGLGTVTLTYKHPAVADHDGYLVARHPFSIYDDNVNIDEAMADIRSQLAGKYSSKPATMEPLSGPDPGPLRMENAAMRDSYEATLESGAGQAADPHGDVIKAVSRQNNAQAPSGHRF